MKKFSLYYSLTLSATLFVPALHAHHGSNIMLGAGLGTAFGAIMGGSDGIVPGLITGMAVGTTAELLDNAHEHHQCETVVYRHKSHKQHGRLERELENLDYAYQKLRRYCKCIEQEIALKDQEIVRLRKKVKNLEYDIANSHRPTFCITTQTVL